MSRKYNYLLNPSSPTSTRILVLGDHFTGKTTFLTSFCSGSKKAAKCECQNLFQIEEFTYGCDVHIVVRRYTVREFESVCVVERVSDYLVRDQNKVIFDSTIEFWELSGEQYYQSYISFYFKPNFFSSFQAILFFYDVTNFKTLENIYGWMNYMFSELEDQNEYPEFRDQKSQREHRDTPRPQHQSFGQRQPDDVQQQDNHDLFSNNLNDNVQNHQILHSKTVNNKNYSDQMIQTDITNSQQITPNLQNKISQIQDLQNNSSQQAKLIQQNSDYKEKKQIKTKRKKRANNSFLLNDKNNFFRSLEINLSKEKKMKKLSLNRNSNFSINQQINNDQQMKNSLIFDNPLKSQQLPEINEVFNDKQNTQIQNQNQSQQQNIKNDDDQLKYDDLQFPNQISQIKEENRERINIQKQEVQQSDQVEKSTKLYKNLWEMPILVIGNKKNKLSEKELCVHKKKGIISLINLTNLIAQQFLKPLFKNEDNVNLLFLHPSESSSVEMQYFEHFLFYVAISQQDSLRNNFLRKFTLDFHRISNVYYLMPIGKEMWNILKAILKQRIAKLINH